jgi:hypothetical protein
MYHHKTQNTNATNEMLFNQSDGEYRLQDSDFRNGIPPINLRHRRISSEADYFKQTTPGFPEAYKSSNLYNKSGEINPNDLIYFKSASKQSESLNLQTWSSDTTNKILYQLLQQIELVKYLTSNS